MIADQWANQWLANVASNLQPPVLSTGEFSYGLSAGVLPIVPSRLMWSRSNCSWASVWYGHDSNLLRLPPISVHSPFPSLARGISVKKNTNLISSRSNLIKLFFVLNYKLIKKERTHAEKIIQVRRSIVFSGGWQASVTRIIWPGSWVMVMDFTCSLALSAMRLTFLCLFKHFLARIA